MVTRRSFLASLLATAALDPERLLWVHGKRTIFVPPAKIVTIEEWLNEQLGYHAELCVDTIYRMEYEGRFR